MSNSPTQRFYWIFCCSAAVGLIVVTFTPLVIPPSMHRPTLWGIPYTLWVGIVVSILLVVVTFIGTRIHPGRKSPDDE